MKRGINFTEAFFLVLFFCKATGTHVFGVVPSWFIVFLPFVISAIFAVLEVAYKERTKFYFWKLASDFRMRRIVKKESKKFSDELKAKSANPGQHYDK